MDYQVWIKDEYEDKYTKVDCGDLEAARREIDKAVRVGAEPILTVGVPYTLTIKVSEVGSEVKKDKAKSDTVARSKSDRKVRPGDEGAAAELDQGSGDNSAGDRSGN